MAVFYGGTLTGMPSAFHLSRLSDIARVDNSTGRPAFSTWPIVAFGFGMMLCLAAVVTIITLSSIKNMRESVLRLTDANQSRREHIDALRTQMYVSSILIRDYLLDNSPERLASYKASLRNNQEAAVSHLKELSRLSSAQSRSTITLLTAEVHAYWKSLESLMPPTDTARPANAYEHVRTHIIPRRQAVISLAEELADLNASEARSAREEVDRSIGAFQRNIVLLRVITTLLALALAIFTTMRVFSLERASKAKHQRLEQAEAEMRKLSQELVVSQEKERRSLARELHDDVGQVLTGLRFGLSDLEQHCTPATPKFGGILANCRGMLEQTIESIRSIAMGLRPSMLDDLGLGAAIEWQAREFSRRFDIPVSVNIDPGAADCPEPQRTALYRVAQEALTNCARHAQATSVKIELVRTADGLRIVITDNGLGMAAGEHTRGFGLVGMQERVKELGGALRLNSSPHTGTTVDVNVPLAGASARA